MYKIALSFISIFFLGLLFWSPVSAAVDNSYINVVMPVRGSEFWQDVRYTPESSFEEYYSELEKRNLVATWLVRFDALENNQIVEKLKSDSSHEVGIFLEITPEVSKKAGVNYRPSANWHQAESILVTGYTPEERIKLIDVYFANFKDKFDVYPQSVGAWWIDAASLKYMQEKYKIKANLAVSDQFSTDGYQVWGLFWSSPFYPSKFNASQPAQSQENKIGVVTTQWAARDPFNGYGEAVESSTYSVQANDYLLQEDLDTNYFNKLLDIYLDRRFDVFSQITIGIENNFTKKTDREEFYRQLDEIEKRKNNSSIVTMSAFADFYKDAFPALSPKKVVFANNPLNDKESVIWYSNNDYRVGLFNTNKGFVIKDLRTYSDTMEEPCLKTACKKLDLAFTTSMQIDEVTNDKIFVVEEGQVRDIKLSLAQDLKVDYIDTLGKNSQIVFAKNDIFFDGKPTTIPGLIIETTTNKQKLDQKISVADPSLSVSYSAMSVLKTILIFLVSFLVLIFLPGRVILRSVIKEINIFEEIILSVVVGISLFLIISFIAFFIKVPWIIWLISLGISSLNLKIKFTKPSFRVDILPITALILGVSISLLPVLRSGLTYPFGIGFWGPNGHDAVWHLGLIESIKSGLPVENIVFANNSLTNYHYFFDLLIASFNQLTTINPLTLYFQIWPLVISLTLGGGVWLISRRWGFNSITTAFVILLTFTAGSWGWVVSYLKDKSFGGESMFWANQAISLHLNPPFVLSLILIVGISLLFYYLAPRNNKLIFLVSLIALLLWEVKAYAGVLVLTTFLGLTILNALKRDYVFLKIFSLSAVFSVPLFLWQNMGAPSLFQFYPLWLVHSMVDSPDRFFWERLSSARTNYALQGNYFKLFLAEGLGVAIFILGNLGLRILGLFFMIRGIFSRDYAISFYAILGLVAIFPSLLFIQSGTPWNTVQFFYYGLFSLVLFSGFAFQYLSKFLPKVILTFVLVILIALSSVTTFSTLSHYYPQLPHSYISNDELKALEALKGKPYGIVLTTPFSETLRDNYNNPIPLFAYASTSYVSAFSAKPTFVADEMNLEILGVNYKNRIIESKEFFKNPLSEWAKDFLKNQNIKYIYLQKDQTFKSDLPFLKRIYEGPEVDVFEVAL